PPDDGLVRRVEEDDAEVDAFFTQAGQRASEVGEELLEELAAARPDGDRRAAHRGRPAQLGDLLDDGGRQVVHHEIAHVLEGARRLRGARTGQAGEDDQLERSLVGALAGGAAAPGAPRAFGVSCAHADSFCSRRWISSAMWRVMPGTARISSTVAFFTPSTEPNHLSSVALRPRPTPGISSSADFVNAASRRWRWKPIAKRCASSRTCCRTYSASDERGI